MRLFYDRDGEIISIEAWMLLNNDRDYIEVAQTKVGRHLVSTIWLGIDYSFGDGAPLIYETMIFGCPPSDEMWRWTTLEEAQAGHENVCEQISLLESIR